MSKILFALLICTVAFSDQNFKIQVEAMHCPLCTSMVRKALLGVEGTQSAKVSLRSKTADVITVDGVKEDDLLKAIEAIGYPGIVLK
ncbi:heavy-metal-associated domain-containing protein [Campylobacter sp. RM9344]|uniref:Heavy-metal-associated domain-containing protein n=1 Tax=Campylobacter californiensis TaxID=1032243 RepID=A0AAW3ZY40_9BACT|nr:MULTISPECIES: heavy metal-associated domain-containing protein [unclassified Campylobacter]MBE2985395.1 heavy-metal-associated domain-containing protein [Campylobacter sp. RM6883]MBE2987156.1 heavy-metal-associated domain-containing protein [Campylobacter sp. RM12919]MBE2987651.1 heavy-metal-associated domain-containing protein [Campylobacter sp. RM12920]MBE2995975.1 heavy-metal-associated domain-containing protein [Campylobacter sp. RM6913]MBE3022294.1 heavy-metal-associated domain-contain